MLLLTRIIGTVVIGSVIRRIILKRKGGTVPLPSKHRPRPI